MDETASLVIRVLSEQVEVANRRLAQLEQQSSKAERKVKKLGAVDFSTVATKLAAFGVSVGALGFAVKATSTEWLNFDKAMKEVLSIAGGTANEFVSLRKDVLALAQALGVDATGAAKGLYQVLSAGIPKEDALAFLGVASKASVAGLSTVEASVDALTAVVNGYGLNASEAEKIADKLFVTVNKGITTLPELAASLSSVAGPAAALGIPLDDLLSQLIAITNKKTSTAEAVTQLRASFTSLTDASPEMVAALDNMGYATARSAIAALGYGEVLNKIRSYYAGDDAAMVKAMRSVEAYAGVLATTGRSAERTAGYLRDLAAAGGDSARAFAINSNILENSLTQVKTSATALVETMENSFGVIAEFGEALRATAQLMSSVSASGFSPDTQNAIGLGGRFGVLTTLEQLDKLIAKQKELTAAGADASKATDAYRRANFGYLPELFTNAGARNADLARTNREIEALTARLDKISDKDKAFGQLNYEVNKLVNEQKKATDPVAIEGYTMRIQALRDEYDLLTADVAADAQAEAANAAATKLADEAELKALQEKRAAAEKLTASEAERLKAALKTQARATDLSKTEVEKLREEQTAVRKLIGLKVEAGGIDEATGSKAIANLEEQIKLIEEKATKTATGGGGGGGSAEEAASSMRGMEGDIETAYQYERDLLQSQLENRLITEQDFQTRSKANWINYNAALSSLSTKNAADVRAKQLGMHAEVLSMASNITDQLTALADKDSAHGRIIFAAAKGVAIAQAIVNTELAATRALAEGGFYMGIPMATVIRGLGYASVGLMAGTAIKQFEHGGMVPAGQYGIVGEAGAELVQGPAVVHSARTTAGLSTRDGDKVAPSTIVQVINNSGAPVRQERSKQGDVEMVRIIVGEATRQVADDITRGGTPVALAMEKKYSLSRGRGGRG